MGRKGQEQTFESEFPGFEKLARAGQKKPLGSEGVSLSRREIMNKFGLSRKDLDDILIDNNIPKVEIPAERIDDICTDVRSRRRRQEELAQEAKK